MDLVSAGTIGAILSGIFSGAAGEAGAQAIEALRKLIRRSDRTEDDMIAVERQLDRPNPDTASAVASWLLAAAGADADFARDLKQWVGETRPHVEQGSVRNTVGRVEGSVIQTGTVEANSIELK